MIALIASESDKNKKSKRNILFKLLYYFILILINIILFSQFYLNFLTLIFIYFLIYFFLFLKVSKMPLKCSRFNYDNKFL